MGRPGRVTTSIVLSVALSALLVPLALAQTGTSSPERELALGDSLRAAFETDAAIQAYRRGLIADPRHPTLLRKAALALSQRAEELPGEEGDDPFHEEAARLARRAVEVAPDDARAHAILAVVLGRYADWTANQRRLTAAPKVVNLGRQAHHHAARALELDPDEWMAHAFLGAMHRRLVTVPMVVRQVAKAFLRWPDVSLDRSRAHLLKSVREEPNQVTTRIELARTYLEMGRREDARRELDAALAIEPKDRLDKLEQNYQARRLRAGLN